ncbi:sensor histidine kinase [Cognatilysobacter lacus]|uniref:histidine kinase n=1 Tax=Cognatilysobacter lacus TaxID=1643323 RepID=A0A5D8Z532_9GAMM|nr:HAMP domain-containing sensor histidine kinase [Lysobacter lacus]TZF89626.1 HAMP domain-containing histidine kinase [Lysobacter lacus]
MIRRLYLRIYVATLAALAAVAVLFALAWWAVLRQPGGSDWLRALHSDALHLHLDGLVLIFVITAVVGVAMYPLARRLTGQIEALVASMDRFGAGELATRAPVAGADEVAHLAHAFNTMADRVTGLMSAHGRMLANASHELRSPLTRIRMALELYEAEPRPGLLQGIREDCTEIDEQIEEILLASKLDTVGIERREEADLAVIVAEECTRLGLPFDVTPTPMLGDTRLLRRLLRNLLENALTHGRTGVEARAFVDTTGDRVVHVTDRGPGIDASERERVFEPFHRPANTRESGNGWGLGLALVRQISEQHGGHARCLGREGGGCTFEFRVAVVG